MTDSLLPAHLQIAFDPAPVAPRRDGWTPARQRDFVDALAVCGSVTKAAVYAGMTPKSAYRLRERPDAASFAAAWDAAYEEAVSRVEVAALYRVLNGRDEPVFFGGRQIGVRRRYDDRLTMSVLRQKQKQVPHCATCDALLLTLKSTGSTEFLRKLVGQS